MAPRRSHHDNSPHFDADRQRYRKMQNNFLDKRVNRGPIDAAEKIDALRPGR
jgi:hypothetical protein